MLADPLLTEHYAKAGLRAVLIDQQHGLSFSSYCYLLFVILKLLLLLFVILKLLLLLFVILKLLAQTNHMLASSMDLAFKQVQLIFS